MARRTCDGKPHEGSTTTIGHDGHAEKPTLEDEQRQRARYAARQRTPDRPEQPTFADVPDHRLTEAFRSARKNPLLAVLEGFHPLKHAVRFDANLEIVITRDIALLERLCDMLAPDVWPRIKALSRIVDEKLFQGLAPVPPDSGVISIASRNVVHAPDLLRASRRSPLILLERPTHLGNVGAVVRVAAGAGASGVITIGPHDPWGPAALRGGAGLQFAVPVTRAESLNALDVRYGPLLAVHPEGELLAPGRIPDEAILAFGSERRGLTDDLLERADGRIAIPMEPGVSSLNLATSVAVMLYTWRLAR